MRFLDLIEAEGRELREEARTVLHETLQLFFGGLLLCAGAVAAAYALFLKLASLIGRPEAALVSAIALGVVGWGLLVKARPKEEDADADAITESAEDGGAEGTDEPSAVFVEEGDKQ